MTSFTYSARPSAERLATTSSAGTSGAPASGGASSDGHFLVDRHPALANAWLVGGGSGHGFKMGPALGEHVAALVHGRATVHPLFAYERLRPRPA